MQNYAGQCKNYLHNYKKGEIIKLIKMSILFIALSLGTEASAWDIGGYALGGIFPPHNEFTVPYHKGNGHARYHMAGRIEVVGSPLDIQFAKACVYYELNGYFGNNIPTKHYSWNPSTITLHHKRGIGLRFDNNIQVGIENGFWGESDRVSERLLYNEIYIKYGF